MVSLSTGAAADGPHTAAVLQQADDSTATCDERPAPACLLNAFVNRALECHQQLKLDQRIAHEWEVVEDVDAEEYVLL